MRSKYLFFSIILISCWYSSTASAQSFEEYKRQQQAKYNSYVQKKTEEYRAYRDRVNAEYADFMRRAWKQEEVQPAKPLPQRPEPPKPEVRKPLDIPQFEAIPFGDVQAPKVPDIPKPEPIIPIDELDRLVISAPEELTEEVPTLEPEQEVQPQPENKPKDEKKPEIKPKDEKKPEAKPKDVKPEGITFLWCGQKWNVPLEKHHRFRLKSVSENDVADAWQMLSGAKYAGVVAACLKIRDAYQLPDWGYLRFLEAMAEAFMPGMQSEARLLEMFILAQSGYQARIARSDGQLYLLVPSSGDIFEYSYISLGGRNFYITDNRSRHGSFYIYERDFPREQPFAWQIRQLPLFSSNTKTRTLQGQRYPEVRVTVEVSKSLMDFMNGYPRCNNWNLYALASLSEQAKKSLYPALWQYIEGKDKKEAVDLLLDFVQTAFVYQTDNRQFGEERSLFGDETLYYPYCDCEDRSILFSILVRELLGLDVVLLNYPNHVATAVCIGDDVKGDYVMLDGRRYVVCDPTYIGSYVGEAMPSFNKTKATIIKL